MTLFLLAWLASLLICCTFLHLWFSTSLPVELVTLLRWIPAVRKRMALHEGEFEHMAREEFDTWLVTLDVQKQVPRRAAHALMCPGCLSVHMAALSASLVWAALWFLSQEPGWRESCVWWLGCVATSPWLCSRMMSIKSQIQINTTPDKVRPPELPPALPQPPTTLGTAGADPDKMVLTLRRRSGAELQVCQFIVQKSTGMVVQETCAPDSGTTLVMPSEDDARRMRLFSATAPCWFAGCEELRAQYQAADAGLPADCPMCHRGALIREYLAKMAALGV